MIVPFSTPFGVTHPLGVPRPIDVDNFFGARSVYFAHNLMPVPCGGLAAFDPAVYRPYLRRLVAWLSTAEFGWKGFATVGEPARYCLLRDGAPAAVPPDLREELPPPPRVHLDSVLRHLSRHHAEAQDFQLFDLLTLIAEDLGPARFAAATARHPWVAAYVR